MAICIEEPDVETYQRVDITGPNVDFDLGDLVNSENHFVGLAQEPEKQKEAAQGLTKLRQIYIELGHIFGLKDVAERQGKKVTQEEEFRCLQGAIRNQRGQLQEAYEGFNEANQSSLELLYRGLFKDVSINPLPELFQNIQSCKARLEALKDVKSQADFLKSDEVKEYQKIIGINRAAVREYLNSIENSILGSNSVKEADEKIAKAYEKFFEKIAVITMSSGVNYIANLGALALAIDEETETHKAKEYLLSEYEPRFKAAFDNRDIQNACYLTSLAQDALSAEERAGKVCKMIDTAADDYVFYERLVDLAEQNGLMQYLHKAYMPLVNALVGKGNLDDALELSRSLKMELEGVCPEMEELDRLVEQEK